MTNLIIEQGNTFTKVAIYNKGVLATSLAYEAFSIAKAKEFLTHYSNMSAGILSSVVDMDCELLDYLKSKLPKFIVLDEHTPIPITVNYRTPSTLGKDRLAAVVGANYLKPSHDLLVIDAGTAVTYDVIESSGQYLGGNISPGLSMRFKALNQFTKKLPLVQAKADEDVLLIGNDTESAMRAGVEQGMVYEMDGVIAELKRVYSKLFVFLTGGNSLYFARRLKNTIFADINLVLTGLNRILEYNVENL
ncbi:MAG: type III pantothenate kinase [Tannerellaceae bacterium]|jgi:type III pantothenate kinase|nr:type III pantothenate kinase [Tannerellaceae bacterium]